MPVTPPVIGPDLTQWGRQLNQFLARNFGRIVFKSQDDNPSENGVFLWNEEQGYPVVSYDNEFVEVVMKHAAPASSTGSAGDTDGMVSWDSNYIYICTADYDGATAIWKRVALTTW